MPGARLKALILAAGATPLLLRSSAAIAEAPPPGAETGVPDFTDGDPASLKIEPIPRREDPETGFLVGGANPTARIDEFRYHGRRYRVTLEQYRGHQDSPFRDGTRTNTNVTVRNLGNNRTLRDSLLVPEMVACHGFHEGEGTPYRVDPRKVLEVLDFLDAKTTP